MNKLFFTASALVSVCALWLAFHGEVAAQKPVSQRASEARKRPRPSYPRQTKFTPSAFATSGLMGQVHMDTWDKLLSIHWSFIGPANTQTFRRASFTLSYWPTAAARVNDSRLTHADQFVVAGKVPSDGTGLIELWSPGFTALPSPTSPSTFSRSQVYKSEEPGRRWVRSASPVVGVANKVLLHFYESNDLMCFDVSTKQLTMSLAASQQAALELESLELFSVGSQVGGGYVYMYRGHPDASRDGSIVMVDSDADGVMDRSQYFTYEQRGEALESCDLDQSFDF